MKKKLFAALLTAALTVSMSVPAFAEIIWTPDKLPEGYTTNEWDNKDFSAKSGTAVKRETYTYYKNDLRGNIMKNAAFAGGKDGSEEIYDWYNGVKTYRASYMRGYCFNEQGYLYTNTITPDGYQVNELGQLVIDGKVITHTGHELNRYHSYSNFPIGYLIYDQESDEKHKDISINDIYF